MTAVGIKGERGTPQWAEYTKDTLRTLLHHNNLPRLAEATREFQATRAWTMLTNAHGVAFPTFEAFVEHPEPRGLGTPYAKFVSYLEAAVGKRTLQLVAVPPAKEPVPPPPGPGRPCATALNDAGHLVPNPRGKAGSAKRTSVSGHTNQRALRAIAERAPEQVRDLYRKGLIGQKEAAKLGPKNPTPEQAARVTEVAIALASEAKDKPATEAERVAVQRRVNAKAREMLGCAVDAVERLARGYRALSPKERKRFLSAIGVEP